MNRLLRTLFATFAALAAWPAAAYNHELLVPALGLGRFAVACSNLEQNTALISASGDSARDFWEGRSGRYIGEALVHPQTALHFEAPVPDDRNLYPGNAGDPVQFVAIVCHPTSRANRDPNYPLPESTDVVPRMQPAGAAPKLITHGEFAQTLGAAPDPALAGEPARLPLIVYSHGLGGSPVGKGYINVMVALASHGYVVGAVFHGDSRFSRVRLEDLGDYFYLLTQFDRVAEMQLMRPLSLKVMTDVLLAHPGFAPGIDPQRIGGFGASAGGQAMANLLGARMTTSLNLTCSDTVRDPRIRAAVGFVPYSGQSFVPAFCDGQRGAEGVDRPYLAIAGTEDHIAPYSMTERAVEKFASSRYLVELSGGQHELRTEDVGDLFTWMMTFLNAYLQVPWDPEAMGRFIRMRGVAGGAEDTLRLDVHVPFPPVGEELRVVEFHNTDLDHYFIAAGQGEIDGILAGAAGPGWRLTGLSFKGWPRTPPDALSRIAPVCRFYGRPAGGPNSHFFTVDPGECAWVKVAGGWFYEGIGFYIEPVGPDGRCPDGYLGVNRAYNNGFPRNDSNHRFSTSDSTIRKHGEQGWSVEGIVMCARP